MGNHLHPRQLRFELGTAAAIEQNRHRQSEDGRLQKLTKRIVAWPKPGFIVTALQRTKHV